MKDIYIIPREQVPSLDDVRLFAPHLIGKIIDERTGIVTGEKLTVQVSDDGRHLFPLTQARFELIPDKLKEIFKDPITPDQCAELINSEEWNANNRFERENQEFLSFVSGKQWGLEPITRKDIDPEKIQIFMEQKGVPQSDIDIIKEPFKDNVKDVKIE